MASANADAAPTTGSEATDMSGTPHEAVKREGDESERGGEEPQGDGAAAAAAAAGAAVGGEGAGEDFAYTRRANEFTSEIFKVLISNIPTFCSVTDLKRLLVKLELVRRERVCVCVYV